MIHNRFLQIKGKGPDNLEIFMGTANYPNIPAAVCAMMLD
jgi:hypothetical protein